jgi:hypothetical protein
MLMHMEPKPAPPEEQTNSSPAPNQGQAMDVVAPPPAGESNTEDAVDKAEAPEVSTDETSKDNAGSEEEQKKPVANKPPKQPGNGVGLAITATVVIVFGLAALATYAYLKTTK